MALFMLGLATNLKAADAGHFFHRKGTPPPGAPRALEHSDHSAGHPTLISPHAEPTCTPAYQGYYVGGGTACGGDPRRVEEGTWGRDYVGIHLPRNVRLNWSHSRRAQGGAGSYKTDGFSASPGTGRDR